MFNTQLLVHVYFRPAKNRNLSRLDIHNYGWTSITIHHMHTICICLMCVCVCVCVLCIYRAVLPERALRSRNSVRISAESTGGGWPDLRLRHSISAAWGQVILRHARRFSSVVRTVRLWYGHVRCQQLHERLPHGRVAQALPSCRLRLVES